MIAKKKLLLSLFFTVITYNTHAQVTIGSDKAAVAGALLDIKESDSSSDGTNSSKGLMLPRVLLTDKSNLYPMFTEGSEDYTGTKRDEENQKHIGLLVYHVGKCTLNGSGLYTWTQDGWVKVGKANTIEGLTTLTNKLAFHNKLNSSGRVDSQSLTVSWLPSTLDAPTYSTTSAFFSVSPSTLTTSPANLEIEPIPMTSTELASNPFLRKEGVVTFSLNGSSCADVEGGTQTNTLSVTHHNKTVKITTPIYTNSENLVRETPISSNANWVVSKIENAGSIPPDFKLKNNGTILTVRTGANWEDDSGKSAGGGNDMLVTTVTPSNSAGRYNYLYLSDNNSSTRFHDILVTVVQCDLSKNPRMSEWAALAGFANVTDVKINDATDIAAGIDTPNQKTSIAWHRDQDGNVFLSSAFGTQDNGVERRWMITSLAAKTFVANGRTGSDNTVKKQWGRNADGSSAVVGKVYNPPSTPSFTAIPMWCYSYFNKDKPSDIGLLSTDYDNDPRIGLLYNWSGATNSLTSNNSTDENNFPDGKLVANNTKKIQGICPNGWHIPSYPEAVDLLSEIRINTSKYSSTPDMGLSKYPYDEASSLADIGIPLKDYCSVKEGYTSLEQIAKVATSNPINTSQYPGYNAVFTGYIVNSSYHNYNQLYYIWTSSANGVDMSYRVGVVATLDTVTRDVCERKSYMSVRCVKDFD